MLLYEYLVACPFALDHAISPLLPADVPRYMGTLHKIRGGQDGSYVHVDTGSIVIIYLYEEQVAVAVRIQRFRFKKHTNHQLNILLNLYYPQQGYRYSLSSVYGAV